MTCAPSTTQAIACPDKEQIRDRALALLPRGRAWGTHDGGPFPGTVPWRFWGAVADFFLYLEERVCALELEFRCATATETRDRWMADYGLPDGCDPFPDLCAKVAAIGGTRCDYYVEIAARAGWAIACFDRTTCCGASAGARAQAGRAKPGRRPWAEQIVIVVDLAASAAYTDGRALRPLAGRLKAGRGLSCGPNIAALQCLLQRIVHAGTEVSYVLVNDPSA